LKTETAQQKRKVFKTGREENVYLEERGLMNKYDIYMYINVFGKLFSSESADQVSLHIFPLSCSTISIYLL
jgi:hypothetical protein